MYIAVFSNLNRSVYCSRHIMQSSEDGWFRLFVVVVFAISSVSLKSYKKALCSCTVQIYTEFLKVLFCNLCVCMCVCVL